MFELLDGFDLSKETIMALEEVCTEDEVKELENCIDRFYSSIMYLREIGVNNDTIENIIKEDYHILIAGRTNIERALKKINNLDGFIQMLNNDIKYMSYLKNVN